jgi:hypothetical protein
MMLIPSRTIADINKVAASVAFVVSPGKMEFTLAQARAGVRRRRSLNIRILDLPAL